MSVSSEGSWTKIFCATKRWFAVQKEDGMRFFNDGAVEDEPAETEEPIEVPSVLDESDDAASETDTRDGSIEKVTEAQECNGLSEQDVTVLRENGVKMRKKRRSVTLALSF